MRSIDSKNPQFEQALRAPRSFTGVYKGLLIENRLRRSLDILFLEDAARVIRGHGLKI
ncbi:MAG: hypothetical protein LBD18_07695 [Treponema sp.]|nr:hypothetical protein [Treponema sp.]